MEDDALPEQNRRMVVERLDYASLFLFPRILRSITMALQPPRLIVGLLTFVALIAVGKLWDTVTEPVFPPGGIVDTDSEVGGAETKLKAQVDMNSALRNYDAAPDEPEDTDEPDALTIEATLEAMGEGYATQRAAFKDYNSGDYKQADRAYLDDVQGVLDLRDLKAFEATAAHVYACFNDIVRGVIHFKPDLLAAAVESLVITMPVELWHRAKWFTVFYGIILLLVLGVLGGALSRMAACEFAGQEKLRMRDAIDFSVANWPRLMLAPILPLLVAGVVAGLIVLLGLLTAVPWLNVLAGLIYPLTLLIGFFVAFVIILYFLEFTMLIPAIAVENCDAAEAQQRAYAYVLRRPLHLAGYLTVTFVGLAIGFVVVAVFAVFVLNTTATLHTAFSSGTMMSAAGDYDPFDLTRETMGAAHATAHDSIGAGLIAIWETLVISLVGGYVLAYLFSAFTMMYLLMRRASDGQDTTEIWRLGLVPGTLAPMPPVTVGTDAPEIKAPTSPPDAQEAPTGWVEGAISGGMKAMSAVRSGKDPKRSLVTTDPSDVEVPTPEDPGEDSPEDLGPELLTEEDKAQAIEEAPPKSDDDNAPTRKKSSKKKTTKKSSKKTGTKAKKKDEDADRDNPAL